MPPLVWVITEKDSGKNLVNSSDCSVNAISVVQYRGSCHVQDVLGCKDKINKWSISKGLADSAAVMFSH